MKPEAIRGALASVELKDSILPGGVLKFTASGQAILPFVVTQNKPGDKVDIVWPAFLEDGGSRRAGSEKLGDFRFVISGRHSRLHPERGEGMGRGRSATRRP